jgi:hypothetical protein
MTEIARLPTEQARFEPQAIFDHPQEIVAEILLTRGQKLATLGRWRDHVLAKQRATDEGMGPADERECAADAALLTAIEEAERELDEATTDETV